MVTVKLFMRATKEPLKRTPVTLVLDGDTTPSLTTPTDRSGIAAFDVPPSSGKVLVSGIERFHGRLTGEIEIGLWSMTQSGDSSDGAPGEFPGGSNAYPDMSTSKLCVDGREILTDSEGYLVNPAEWSEGFAKAQATTEGLQLGAEHWEVIRFLRQYFVDHGTQASVRDMIKYFRSAWDGERGSSRHLHKLFPRGGPQKQGNRLAGLLRTKGEH